MRLAIHQPQYLPWLGYFDKINKADVFVILDNVQYKKNEWQNRNKIKTVDGWQWLTVPVLYKFPQKIQEVRINNRLSWNKKHLKSIKINYQNSQFFDKYYPRIKEILNEDWNYISKINIRLIKMIVDILGIRTKLILASTLNTEGSKTDRLISICRETGADHYLSGIGAKDYLETDKFNKENIKLEFQDFKHLVYPQQYGRFEPYMSVIDLIFNCGEDNMKIIEGKND